MHNIINQLLIISLRPCEFFQTTCLACSMVLNQLGFRHSSLTRALKLSINALSTGLPGRIKCSVTSLVYADSSMALLINSGPLSTTMFSAKPCIDDTSLLIPRLPSASYGSVYLNPVAFVCIRINDRQYSQLVPIPHDSFLFSALGITARAHDARFLRLLIALHTSATGCKLLV